MTVPIAATERKLILIVGAFGNNGQRSCAGMVRDVGTRVTNEIKKDFTRWGYIIKSARLKS